MIEFVTGDLLASNADCLVNTVNCEGYMGKGIAYQFKMKFPNNNVSYVKACKSNELTVGKLHVFSEGGKIIINFPTKNKWRASSKMEYITLGLDELVKTLPQLGVQSIAIPPLGSGNGGLVWSEVKDVVIEKLTPIAENYAIYIYEPSKNYSSKPVQEPHLSCASLVLMQIKLNLNKFNKLRLQKAAFFTNLYSEEEYFHFKKYTYGPYDNSIDILSKSIKSYQQYHNVKNTSVAYDIAYKQLVSEKVINKLEVLMPGIIKATEFVNKINDDKALECISTVAFILKENGSLLPEEILKQFQLWSKRKEEEFSLDDINRALKMLIDNNLVVSTLFGYDLNK